MTSSAPARSPIRFRGRSFLAIVLAPEAPVADWLADLDALVRRSPAFFVGRPVIVDVSGLGLLKPELTALIGELNAREIRIMAVEGADPASLGLGLPPPLNGGRPVEPMEVPGPAAPQAAARPAGGAPSLMLESPVRSGQSIIFPEGDVTILGSVASGAEVIAGGSIHVYGALRGRAIAGTTGNARARIYCRKFEAELLAIDGLYKTADEMEGQFRGQPVQVWLDGEAITIAALD